MDALDAIALSPDPRRELFEYLAYVVEERERARRLTEFRAAGWRLYRLGVDELLAVHEHGRQVRGAGLDEILDAAMPHVAAI